MPCSQRNLHHFCISSTEVGLRSIQSLSTVGHMADPCDFVIFGGTGDLAVRKLLPALYLRDRDGQLTADTRIIAVARAGLDEPGYRDKVHAELGRFVATELLDGETIDRFLARLRFVSIDLTEPSDYVAVTDLLA